MKASLDTNVLIHLYSANKEGLLFDFFEDGVLIYEQIREIELNNHGQAVLARIDRDISDGKIEVYTDDKLRQLGVHTLFKQRVNETRILYGSGDMGEVYAIVLAQTLGVMSLVTDDTKLGGPYMSLLQFENEDVMPFNFADIIILSYLAGRFSASESFDIFNSINEASNLNWSYKSKLGNFVRRFWSDPDKQKDKQWVKVYCERYGVSFAEKVKKLGRIL